jgi:hypothetical protein
METFVRKVKLYLWATAIFLGIGLILYAILLGGCQVFYYINTGSWIKLPVSAFFMEIPYTPSNAFPNPLQLIPVFRTPLSDYLRQPWGWIWFHRVLFWMLNFFHALFLPLVLGWFFYRIAGAIEKEKPEQVEVPY